MGAAGARGGWEPRHIKLEEGAGPGGGCRCWKKMALVEKRRRRRHWAGQPMEGLGRGESPAGRAPGEGRGCVGTPVLGGRAGRKGG